MGKSHPLRERKVLQLNVAPIPLSVLRSDEAAGGGRGGRVKLLLPRVRSYCLVFVFR